MRVEAMNQPTPQHPFKSRNFLHSLGYACNGLRSILQTERNFRTHVLLTGLVVAAGFFFQVSQLEWVVLTLCITLMLAVEAMNTAIEYMVDAWVDGVYSDKAKVVKDISAGACLMTATGTAITGFLIFLPHLQKFFE